MKRPRIRLVVAATIFVAWLGWLAYLAITQANPMVVSRSQIMAATNFVVAEVTVDPETGLPERTVKVVEDLRPGVQPLAGNLLVVNLREARIPKAKEFKSGVRYLLPLTAAPGGRYELTLQPRSPGQDAIDYQRVRPWAYPWDSDEVRKQFERMAR